MSNEQRAESREQRVESGMHSALLKLTTHASTAKLILVLQLSNRNHNNMLSAPPPFPRQHLPQNSFRNHNLLKMKIKCLLYLYLFTICAWETRGLWFFSY